MSRSRGAQAAANIWTFGIRFMIKNTPLFVSLLHRDGDEDTIQLLTNKDYHYIVNSLLLYNVASYDNNNKNIKQSLVSLALDIISTTAGTL